MRKARIIVVFCMTMLLMGCKTTSGRAQDSAENGTSDAFQRVDELKDEENKLTLLETVETGLCELLEKKDATKQAQYNAMNRMLRSNSDENQESLFCVDADSGVSYFVNQEKDWFIYRIKDGEVKLAVALPAKELYMWDGTLYFMLESYEKYDLGERQRGDIYSYTPIDGTVKLVYEAGKEGDMFQKLTVNENGIFFSMSKYKNAFDVNGEMYYTFSQKNMQLPFGASDALKDSKYMTMAGWKDYFFTYKRDEESKTQLFLKGRENENDSITLDTIYPNVYCVVGDLFYYGEGTAQNTVLYVRNLVTGETRDYDCNEILTAVGMGVKEESRLQGAEGIHSFVIVRDDIWVTLWGVHLISIDLDTGEMSYFGTGNDNRIETLYTDGEHLYATCGAINGSKTYMAQILTEQIVEYNEYFRTPVLGVKYLTE